MDAEILRSLVERRRAALERFAAWDRRQPWPRDPAVAFAGIGALWHLLPPEARDRPIDARGVAAMHRALAVLR
jgi:hypothetical protein